MQNRQFKKLGSITLHILAGISVGICGVFFIALIGYPTVTVFAQDPVSETPSATFTPTETALADTPTLTETPSPSSTLEETQAASPTATETHTPTSIDTSTSTVTESPTVTVTFTPTITASIPRSGPSGILGSRTFVIPGLPWLPTGSSWRYNQGPYDGISHFGAPDYPLDFGTPNGGPATVYAMDSGKVVEIGTTCIKIESKGSNAGLTIWYQHVSVKKEIRDLFVKNTNARKETPISLGQDLGTTTLTPGCNGRTGGHHVHIYWKFNEQYVPATLNGWEIVGTRLQRNIFGTQEVVSPNAATIRYCATPTIVKLSAPSDKKIFSDKTPKLKWERNPCGARYEIRISTNSRFPEGSKTKLYKLDKPNVEFTTPGLSDGVYFWQVRAIGIAGEQGQWSNPQSFTIDTTPPNRPTLSSPSAGSFISNGFRLPTDGTRLQVL